MSTEMIEVQIDTKLLEDAEPILASLGLTPEEAIEIFINETVRRGDLPFPYTKEDIDSANKSLRETEVPK